MCLLVSVPFFHSISISLLFPVFLLFSFFSFSLSCSSISLTLAILLLYLFNFCTLSVILSLILCISLSLFSLNHSSQTFSFSSRIFELLPQRIQQWQQSPCVAEENNKKSLEQMRNEMMKVKLKIAELDDKIKKLQLIIVKAKSIPIKMEQDVG